LGIYYPRIAGVLCQLINGEGKAQLNFAFCMVAGCNPPTELETIPDAHTE
jgi:hypothetical protein